MLYTQGYINSEEKDWFSRENKENFGQFDDGGSMKHGKDAFRFVVNR